MLPEFIKWLYNRQFLRISCVLSLTMTMPLIMDRCADTPLEVLAAPFNELKIPDKRTAPTAMDAPAGQSVQPPENSIREPSRTRHHPAFLQHAAEREKMVRRQIQGRGIRNPETLIALNTVPRHAFVPSKYRHQAYTDRPLPIGYGQTISQPYVVAYMTEALNLQPDAKVLEIGTGSAYQAAVCAEMAREVYTIEIVEPLARTARNRLADLGYANVSVKAGDGYYGWPEKAPFDAIIVTAAAGFVPPPLIEQLKDGGRLILPLGSPYGLQTLVRITKNEKKTLSSWRLLPVRFVPMLGRITENR